MASRAEKALEDLTFEELEKEEDALDIATKKVEKQISRATVIIMIFDAINLVIALSWIVMISFAWSMQPSAIGTFMMQFLYLPYVLVLHSFFGELRRFLSKLQRRLIPTTLVTIQTIIYYIGAAFIITSAMLSVTVLRFASRIVESNPLYYSAIGLSFVIDVMAFIQMAWIVYTLIVFVNSWRNVGKQKAYLTADPTFGALQLIDDIRRTSWPTREISAKFDSKMPKIKKKWGYTL